MPDNDEESVDISVGSATKTPFQEVPLAWHRPVCNLIATCVVALLVLGTSTSGVVMVFTGQEAVGVQLIGWARWEAVGLVVLVGLLNDPTGRALVNAVRAFLTSRGRHISGG